MQAGLGGMPLHRGQAEEISKIGYAAGQQAGHMSGQQVGYEAGARAGFQQGSDQAAQEIMARLNANDVQGGANNGEGDPRMDMAVQVADLMMAAKQGDPEATKQLEVAINDLSQTDEGKGILSYADQMVTDAENPDQAPSAGIPR